MTSPAPMDPTTIRGLFARIRAVHLGVDLGQAQDFSAVALVEVGERPASGGGMYRDFRQTGGQRVWPTPSTYQLRPVLEATYRVQRLMRLDLRTSYLAVAGKDARVVAHLGARETC